MLLSELLSDIDYKRVGADVKISAVSYDSRKVRPGHAFFAIRGFKEDGHDYIDAAIKNGAAAIIMEDERELPLSGAVVKNARLALAAASARFYGHPAKRMRIIGVTGTNGKTSVSYLIKQVLDLLGYKTGLIGTNQNMIGERVIPADKTTPESVELNELLLDMANEGVGYVIMEVSSHSLALERVAHIEFDVCVFTNLTRDHLDFHHDMEEYFAAKEKLFKVCRAAVINTGDEYGRRLFEKALCPALSFNVGGGAELCAKDVRLSERGVIFTLEKEGESAEVRVGIPGIFTVYNALAAIGACMALGVQSEDIIKGLVLARNVKGRVEVVQIAAPYTVIIDYAHTPDGLLKILTAVRDFALGRVILLFGCGGNRDKTKRPLMGEIAQRLSDVCIVTSDNPRDEEPEEIINDILKGMDENAKKPHVIPDRRAAIEFAMETAQKDDIIILAGKGHETYQIIKDKRNDFDERLIVKEIFERNESRGV